MTFIETLIDLQHEAVRIQPPADTDRLPAVGGLPGPAFFPEGFGLTDAARRSGEPPVILAIGHNFGCEKYRRQIDAAGREDGEATWRNLDTLLRDAGSHPDKCFRTNWFIGLLPGEKQTGVFLRNSDAQYEQACLTLLIKQLVAIRPTSILLLGPEVASRANALIPALSPWKGAQKWVDIDRSVIGHSVRDAQIPRANMTVNVAALLHSSFGPANQSRRMKNMDTPIAEAQIVRRTLI